MKVILLTGKQRAGKDTVAGIMADMLNESGKKARPLALADVLKREWLHQRFHGNEMFDSMTPLQGARLVEDLKQGRLSRMKVYHYGLERSDITKFDSKRVRQELINTSGLIKKHCGDTFYAESVQKRIKQLKKEGYSYVFVTDCRFMCEIDYLRKHNDDTITLRVECPRSVRSLRGHLSCEEDPSETELDNLKVDYVFHNGTSNLRDLQSQVSKLLQEMLLF